jgi:hypothetical protein
LSWSLSDDSNLKTFEGIARIKEAEMNIHSYPLGDLEIALTPLRGTTPVDMEVDDDDDADEVFLGDEDA